MGKYEEERVKLTNSQLKKLKSAAESNIGAILRITKEYFARNMPVHL